MKKNRLKFFGIGILLVLGSLTTQAQSIVGKWERVSVKRILIEKSTGRRTDASVQAAKVTSMVKQVIEFRSDNTWAATSTFAGSKKGLTIDGTYTFSGNHLSAKLNPKQEKEFKDAADQLKKNKNYHPSSGSYMPREISLRSLTATTMVWFNSGDENIEGGDGKKTAYSIELETTYKKL